MHHLANSFAGLVSSLVPADISFAFQDQTSLWLDPPGGLQVGSGYSLHQLSPAPTQIYPL